MRPIVAADLLRSGPNFPFPVLQMKTVYFEWTSRRVESYKFKFHRERDQSTRPGEVHHEKVTIFLGPGGPFQSAVLKFKKLIQTVRIDFWFCRKLSFPFEKYV